MTSKLPRPALLLLLTATAACGALPSRAVRGFQPLATLPGARVSLALHRDPSFADSPAWRLYANGGITFDEAVRSLVASRLGSSPVSLTEVQDPFAGAGLTTGAVSHTYQLTV